MKRTIQCKHSINIDKCSECYPIFLKETTVTTTEQPNEQWLDEILSKDRLTDVYSRNEQVIMVSGDLSSATPLKSAILKHTRSVEAIEKMLGSKIIPILEDLVVHTANEYGGFDGFDEDADDGSRDGINKALAEIRAALGLGEQDV